MKPLLLLFGLLSLMPAAFNATPAPARGPTMALCDGDGVARGLVVPLGRPGLPGSEPPACCVKGCHAGGARKRARAGRSQREV